MSKKQDKDNNQQDLTKEILLQTKNLYELKIKVSTGEEKNTSLIKKKKKEIAQLKTQETAVTLKGVANDN